MIATAERSRLDTWRAKEAELSAERDVVRERLAGYSEKITAARQEAWYSKPSKRPLTQLNSPLQKLIDADAKDAKTLAGLEADLSAVRSLIEHGDAKVREQETAEARAQLEQLHSSEERIWQEAGKLLGELAATWGRYTELAEQESRLAQENGLDGSGALAVVPAPLTFRSWLLLLHKVATDPEVRAEPITESLVDAGVFGNRDSDGNALLPGVFYDVRPAGTRQIETRRKLDYGDRLVHVVPDLRNVVSALALSGQVPTITAE